MSGAIVENTMDEYTDLPVGDILYRTRMHYGQSLITVSKHLRIRESQLEALEKGEIERLPGRVYAIGFIRSYSEYLGLDGDKMVHLFKRQARDNYKPELNFPTPAEESMAPSPYLVMAALFVLIAGITVFSIFLAPNKPASTAIPPVPEDLKDVITAPPSQPLKGPMPESSKNTSKNTGEEKQDQIAQLIEEIEEEEKKTGVNSESRPENRIILEVEQDSWIEIKKADGSVILRRVLKSGDRYLVPDEEGLILSTGNAGGFSVIVDGNNIPKIGRPAQVRRNIKLDPDTLLAR